MSVPHLGNLTLHAYCKVNAAAATVSDQINVASINDNGVGLFTVVLGTQINPNQRHLSVTLFSEGVAEINDNSSPAAFAVLTKTLAGAPADIDFEVAVFRVEVPS